MFYLWLIPLAASGSLVVFGLYMLLRGRARRAAGNEAKSPLDLAQEMERQEEAADQQKRCQEKKAA